MRRLWRKLKRKLKDVQRRTLCGLHGHCWSSFGDEGDAGWFVDAKWGGTPVLTRSCIRCLYTEHRQLSRVAFRA